MPVFDSRRRRTHDPLFYIGCFWLVLQAGTGPGKIVAAFVPYFWRAARCIEMSTRKIRAVYQLRVSLTDIEPAIWRRIHVWEDTKLPQLHRILQALFNWENYHLHEFVVGRRVYTEPDPEDNWFGRKIIDERDIPLSRLAERVGSEFDYHYDFGDNWHHLVLLEAILLPEAETFYPRCTAGARSGPPEDAGGGWGYINYLEALADRKHPEHEEKLAWRGPFDAEAFSLRRINALLKKRFYRRRKSSSAPAVLASATDTTLPLELSDHERELVLMHSGAPDQLTRALRAVPLHGEPAAVRYTVDDLGELAGYLASESNHAKNRKLHRQWQSIHEKIAALLKSHTGGEK
jgi:Plasmid pRiA4b ORF-3-like protein